MGAFLWGFVKGIFGSLLAKIFGTDKEAKLETENMGLRKKVVRARSETIGKTNEMAYKDGLRKRKQAKKDAKSTKERVANTSRRYKS